MARGRHHPPAVPVDELSPKKDKAGFTALRKSRVSYRGREIFQIRISIFTILNFHMKFDILYCHFRLTSIGNIER